MKLVRVLSIFLYSFMCYSNVLMAKVIDVELLTEKSYMPYSYVEKGELKGIYVDLLNEAFALMPGYSLKLTPIDWSQAKKNIRDGKQLGLVGSYFHGHDLPYMYPYSIALGKETVVTVCHPSVFKSTNISWPEDYKGLLVGNVEGYDGWLNYRVRSEEATKNINFLEVPTSSIAFDMVKNARLDCILFDEAAYYFSTANLDTNALTSEGKQILPILSSRLSVKLVHIAYSLQALKDNTFPYALDFQHALDVAVFTLEESGKADEIRKKYTSVSLSPVY